MHTDTLSMKKPAGDGNPTAGHTDSSTVTTSADAEMTFRNLRAAYAMQGHALLRADPADGTVNYLAKRWGLVRYLPTIDVARHFLKVIGGRL
jgi:hypothetical protein